MKKATLVVFSVFIILLSFVCNAATIPGSEEDAKALLAQFLEPGADCLKLTKMLRPTEKDYKKYFIEKSWKKARNMYDETFWSKDLAIKANTGQTQILIWKATPKELKNGTGSAEFFPGGYRRIADQINPKNTVYYFKFVVPGKTSGMSYDGLVFINGHWAAFPKPWKVLSY